MAAPKYKQPVTTGNNQTLIWVLAGIIILLLSYLAYKQYSDEGNSNVEALTKEIKTIQKDVDSLQQSNADIDVKLDGLKKPMEDIDKSIDSNNSKIDKLKQYETSKCN